LQLNWFLREIEKSFRPLPPELRMIKVEENKSEVWAIILAGGESKRMKTPKLLLPFRGKTMIESVIENVTSSKVDNTMVVLGSVSELILEIITGLKVNHCYNDNYKEGMLSSVKCGFRNLPPDLQAVLVFQGDQPLIPPQTVNDVINSWRMSGKGIVIPVSSGKRGHPILIDRKYRDEVEKLREDVLEVEVNTSVILRDIDTPEDYINEINQII
jgi:molybdenum cofactor cytidylyltransferase